MHQQSVSFSKAQWLVLACLVVLSLLLADFLARQELQRQQQIELRQLSVAVGQLRALLETEVNSPLHLSAGLVAYIKANHGQVNGEVFAKLLPSLVQQGRHIRNIGIAPDNQIQYIFPLEGNAAVLGVRYEELPQQWPAIEQIIQSRQPELVGPIKLTQGGDGFIHRIPVFLDNGNYWGMVSTVLNTESIWTLLAERAADEHIRVALRQFYPQGNSIALFGDADLFKDNSILLNLTVAGVRWQLAAAAQQRTSDMMWPIRLVSGGICSVLILMVAGVFRANRRWQVTADALTYSENYYRSVMEHVADAIVVLNEHEQIEMLNPAAINMFGYQPAELQGLSWHVLFPHEPPSIQHGQQLELQVSHKSSQLLNVELNRTPFHSHAGQMTLLLFRDITERRRVERLKSEFVSTVSHELRTPLTAINGAIGLLAASSLGSMDQSQQQLLDIAKQNSDQLNLLINDLLDIDKLALGKLPLTLLPCAVIPLLQQAILHQQSLAQKNGVQLVLFADLSLSLKVLIDPARLSQVLTNLLLNAINFSPANTQIMLKAEIKQQHLRVSVIDQGPGVPTAFVPRLFHKFSQADSSDSRQRGGTGLGLAISKQLIEQMHGTIAYQENPLGGACFYFELPLPQVSDEQHKII